MWCPQNSGKLNFSQRGFTLLELLVVIGVIGLLAAVIMASLKSARTRASDAAIKSNLITMVKSSALEYDNLGGTYNTGAGLNSGFPACNVSTGGTISQNSQYQAAIAQIINLNGLAVGTGTSCVIYPTAYSIAVFLKSGAVWCIDSTGRSTGTTLAGATYSNNQLGGSANHAQTDGTDTACN